MFHTITIKLFSTNYLLWQNQILPLLSSQNLFGYINGSVSKPLGHILSDSISISNMLPGNHQHLLILLLFSLTKEAMVEVHGLYLSCSMDYS